MSASDHLSNIQFSKSMYRDGQADHGAVFAHDGDALRLHEGKSYQSLDNIVGKLSWGMEHNYGHPDVAETTGPHEIDEVWVHPDYRRAGIATAMLGFARSVSAPGKGPQHSSRRTDAGEAWAQAQGAPPRKEKSGWHDRSGMHPE